MAEPRLEEPPVAVSPEDIQVTPRRTGRSRVDLIIAGTAIFLSVVSLFVAIQNAWTQREMVSASTWPFITAYVKIGGNEHNDIQFGISNSGVGPAKIRSYEVFYKGQAVTSFRDILRRCCGLPKDRKTADALLVPQMASAHVNQTVLRAGEDQFVVVFRPDPQKPELAERFSRALSDVSFRGCYCSVLDECWTSELTSTEATRVRTCPDPKRPFDANGP